jgi:uncharacterized membrane protein YfcA
MVHFLSGLFPSMTVFVLLCVATAFAGALRGFSGFGSGLLLAPIYSLFLPPTSVVTVVLLLNLVTVLQMLPQALRLVQWRLVMALFVPSLFGIPLGLLLLHTIDAVLMRKLIAGIVTVMSLVLLSGWLYKGRRGALQNCIAGLSSGCLTAIAGIGGPPILLYLLSGTSPSPTVLRSVFLVYFAMAQLSSLIPLAVGGSVGLTQVAYAGSLLPVYILATAAGAIMHRRMAGRQDMAIRKVSLWFLLAIGVVTFFV